MKDKKWVDCPSCGSTNSMVFKSKVTENYNLKDYGLVKIADLEGYFCKVCKDFLLLRFSLSQSCL